MRSVLAPALILSIFSLVAACGVPPPRATATPRATNTPRPERPTSTPRPTATPGPGSAELREVARQAVLNYEACPGVTLGAGAVIILRAAGAQEIQGSLASYDLLQQLYVVEIRYKAANGAAKELKFNYRPLTGVIAAENDDGLTVLHALRSQC